MDDMELQKKREKSAEYAEQPERFSLMTVKLRMNSTHGDRLISYDSGQWECTCDFFSRRGVCSHTLAAQEILQKKASLRFE